MQYTLIYQQSQPAQILSRIGFLIAFLMISTQAFAAKDPIYTSLLSNKAVGGYDAVSYFQNDGKPIKGQKAFTLDYKGADWFFSSQENLDMFKAEPEKYAPQFGGYCAWAIANNDIAKGDPLQYYIEEDKLYLNINAKYRKIWLDDINNFIVNGEANWPSVLE